MSRPSKSASSIPTFPVADRHETADELLGPLARLRLQGYGPDVGRDPFVGGFARPPASSSSASSPGREKPLPPPPPSMAMPHPTSYPAASINAMYPIPPLPEPPRMYFAPPRPTLAVEALLAQPAPAGPWRSLAHSAPPPTVAVPVTPHRRRSSSSATAAGLVAPTANPARGSSVPPSPASDVVQCSATTKQGKRCTKKVKAGLPLTYFDGAPEELERYCHIHLKEALAPSGFYSRKNKSVWVEFEDWIPHWLSSETQAAMRVEMEKAASTADAGGYIYTFELRQPVLSADVHLKVGRTNNVHRRLHEWGKQCGKEVVPRGLWPAPADEGASMLLGQIRPGPMGPFAARLERLIHLELADLAVLAPYLPEEDRPKLPARPPNRRSSSDGTGTSMKKAAASPGKPPARPRVLCACGKLHQEIFMFQRAKSGKYKDHIWEQVVQPVIKRWGEFVEEHVALPP